MIDIGKFQWYLVPLRCRLVLPKRIDAWPLTSFAAAAHEDWEAGQSCPVLLVVVGRGDLHRRLFGQMLQRIYALRASCGKWVGFRLRSVMRQQAALVKRAKTSRRDLAGLAGIRSGGKFAVSRERKHTMPETRVQIDGNSDF